MSKDMERLTEALEGHAIATNDFDVIVAESIAEGVLESTWLTEHDAKVRAETVEYVAQIAADTLRMCQRGGVGEKFGVTNRAASWIEREAGLK